MDQEGLDRLLIEGIDFGYEDESSEEFFKEVRGRAGTSLGGHLGDRG